MLVFLAQRFFKWKTYSWFWYEDFRSSEHILDTAPDSSSGRRVVRNSGKVAGVRRIWASVRTIEANRAVSPHSTNFFLTLPLAGGLLESQGVARGLRGARGFGGLRLSHQSALTPDKNIKGSKFWGWGTQKKFHFIYNCCCFRGGGVGEGGGRGFYITESSCLVLSQLVVSILESVWGYWEDQGDSG